ncbi:YkvA family protein [Promicromonospora sp. NPDC023987]|uniref:YkvA family protein n=1 Tax=Promicromonospora sp. NPDC023987 TaxID=3155360 RepID=UPI00340F64B2
MGEESKRGKDPRKFTWQEIFTFIAGAGYVASPIDLVPDLLGPLGLGDDAIAIVIAGVTLYKAVQRFRKHRPVPGTTGDTASDSTGTGGSGAGTSTPGGTAPGAPSSTAAPGSYTTGKTIPGTAEDVTPDRRNKR